MSSPIEIAHQAESLASEAALRSQVHGPRHWRDVARIGARLCRETPGASPRCVLIFAAVHDSQRLDDWEDPRHGARAADVLRSSINHGLQSRDLERLLYAIRHHSDPESLTHEDPVVGACWDADRLTLHRVGIEPGLPYMSTPAVRENLAGWRQRALEITEGSDSTWETVVAGYEALSQRRG